MRHIFLFVIVAFLIISCNSGGNKNTEIKADGDTSAFEADTAQIADDSPALTGADNETVIGDNEDNEPLIDDSALPDDDITETGDDDTAVIEPDYDITAIIDTVATPRFDIPEGTYNAAQTVTISTQTEGATIIYTTDGTDPAESSAIYSSPLTISSTATLKALAFKSNWDNSAIQSAQYTIIPGAQQVASPQFDLPAGTYPVLNKEVKITCATQDAIIRYTTDGSEPTAKNGSDYTAPVKILIGSTTLKAKGLKNGMADSPVVKADYFLPPFWKNITAGGNHTCAIKESDGTLYCWGDNTAGQIGDATNEQRNSAVKIGSDSWRKVSAGYHHTCAIRESDSRLYCWGGNCSGELGNATLTDKNVPVKIGDDTWQDISAGFHYTCGIKTDNRLYCWGYNYFGQLGDNSAGTGADRNEPKKIGDEAWLKISAGSYHTCGIKTDNSLYCWGDNDVGQLGDGGSGLGCSPYGMPGSDTHCSDKHAPEKIGYSEWSDVKAAGGFGGQQTCGIKTDGSLYCWGNYQVTPAKISDDSWIKESTGTLHTCAIKADKTLYCWGNNQFAQIGNGTVGNSSALAKIGADTDAWYEITAGYHHTCGIKATDNRLYCWGDNSFGQIGDGTSGQSGNKAAPVKVGDDKWLEIAAGTSHTCGIKEDSKLYCWGDNNHGKLGNGTTVGELTPKKTGDDSWLSIAAGYHHTCAVKADNRLYCWGYNLSGQLGDGTSLDSAVPAKIGNDPWSAVKTGGGYSEGSHSCGIKTDGSLYCWGDNQIGKLGTGTYYSESAPASVGGSWSEIVAGEQHTCGIKTNGLLYCWGYNFNGQLGDGTQEKKNIPVKVDDDSWKKVTAGWSHTCGIKASDSKLYCWGINSEGELGDGTAADKKTPVKTGDDKWQDVSAGGSHTCGIRADGTLYCWGYNFFGELGDNTTANSNIPVKIGDSTWSRIAAGGSHTCGIQTDGILYCWGESADGKLGIGTALKTTPTLVVEP